MPHASSIPYVCLITYATRMPHHSGPTHASLVRQVCMLHPLCLCRIHLPSLLLSMGLFLRVLRFVGCAAHTAVELLQYAGLVQTGEAV
jgi:hypothetical protein